jgi:catechol 2,3-dioxygenase-like lactoylglutathione lyase family enzyme
VLQHVSIEVPADEKEQSLEFWRLLGFHPVDAPGPISEYVDWVEREGTQIHLIYSEQPTVPALGHPAVVVADFDAATGGLTDAGFAFEESDRLWGARRGFAIGPGGHRVELMESPPPPSR